MLSKSSPPKWLSPAVDNTSNTPSPNSKIDTSNDLEAMKAKRDALNEVVQNLSVKLYEQAAAASQAAQGAAGAEQASSQPQDGVVDADFEEVQD